MRSLLSVRRAPCEAIQTCEGIFINRLVGRKK